MTEIETLILVDCQKGFHDPIWGKRNNPDAESVMGRVLENWKRRRWPIVHVQHLSVDSSSPLFPNHPGSAFMQELSPTAGERVFTKKVNSAFIGTDLESYLKARGLRKVVFCGFTTDHCVSTSVRMAKNLGFEPAILADACVSFDRIDYRGVLYQAETVHAVSLASLNGEFARVRMSSTYFEN